MDRDRVAALYQTYGGLVYRRALRLLDDPAEAEIALQEVFVRVLKRLDGYSEEERVLHWLFRITTNYCLDQRRAAVRRPARVSWSEQVGAGGVDPVSAVAAREILTRVLQEGGRRRRLIACLRYLDGMTQERIAEITGLSRRTVGKHLRKLGEDARLMAGGVA